MAQGIKDPTALLSERELAGRWRKSRRTLQRWRAAGYGAAYIVIGDSVFYQVQDVHAFEMRQRRGIGAEG